MPKKVLVADDSLTIQKVIELTFSEENYEVVSFSNGRDALDYLKNERADIILADVVMPELNGYELCREAKILYPTLPVILLTGTFEPFDKQKALEVKSDDAVIKPFDSQALIQKVEELTSKAPIVEEKPMGEVKEVFPQEMTPPFESSQPSPIPEEPSIEGLLPEEQIEEKMPEKLLEEPLLAEIPVEEQPFPMTSLESEQLLETSPPFPEQVIQEQKLEEEPQKEGILFSEEKVEEPLPQEPIFEEKPFEEVPTEQIPIEEEKETISLEEAKEEVPFIEEKEEIPLVQETIPEPKKEIFEEQYVPPSMEEPAVLYEEPPSYEEPTIPFEEKEGRIPELEEKSFLEKKYEEEKLPEFQYEEKVEEVPLYEEKKELKEEKIEEVPLYEVPKEEKVEKIPQKTEEIQEVQKEEFKAAPTELTKAQIDEIARKVVEYLSDEVVKQIAWEVVPELADLYIKQKIKELEEEE